MHNPKLSRLLRKQAAYYPTGAQLVVSISVAGALFLWANLLAGNFN